MLYVVVVNGIYYYSHKKELLPPSTTLKLRLSPERAKKILENRQSIYLS